MCLTDQEKFRSSGRRKELSRVDLRWNPLLIVALPIAIVLSVDATVRLRRHFAAGSSYVIDRVSEFHSLPEIPAECVATDPVRN